MFASRPLRALVFNVLALLFAAAALTACGDGAPPNEVVVYCAWDDAYAGPLLKEFEKEKGIKVRLNLDIETNKTSWLRTKLIAEKSNPRCDLFWNNEPGQTHLLKAAGVLRPIPQPVWDGEYVKSIPAAYKDGDADRSFVGFAARARVIIYNTNRLTGPPPKGLADLLDPRFKGQVGIADPKAGTTATHAAMLFVKWGPEKAEEFFKRLRDNDVQVENGNAVVAQNVAGGALILGLTDTDDANLRRLGGAPVNWVYPDQEGEGTPVLPNTLMLIRNSRNQKNAETLIAWLLSRHVEEALAQSKAIQMPLGAGAKPPAKPASDPESPIKSLAEIRAFEADLSKAAPIIEGRCQSLGADLRAGH